MESQRNRNLPKCLSLALLLCEASFFCTPAWGSAGQIILLPWFAVPQSAQVATLTPALAASHKAFAAQIMENSISLLEYSKKYRKKPLPLNLQAIAQKSWTVDREIKKDDTPHFVTPILCKIADRWLIGLQKSAASSDLLLGLEQSSVSARDLFAAKAAQAEILQNGLRTHWANIENAGTKAKESALQIGLRSGRAYSRFDQGSEICLELLFKQKLLASNFRVLSRLGEESEKTVREHILQLPTRLERSTLELVLHLEDRPKTAASFPLAIQFGLSTLNGVFGNAIASQIPKKGTLSIGANSRIDFALPEDVENFLLDAKNGMSLDEPPKIIWVHRAWIYLDRGRAWGLKMDDRMLVSGSGGMIKGHVVGFFGPELNLKTPEGRPIHDGAIVFVRKGQKKAQIGQSLEFDPREFPTPWPP